MLPCSNPKKLKKMSYSFLDLFSRSNSFIIKKPTKNINKPYFMSTIKKPQIKKPTEKTVKPSNPIVKVISMENPDEHFFYISVPELLSHHVENKLAKWFNVLPWDVELYNHLESTKPIVDLVQGLTVYYFSIRESDMDYSDTEEDIDSNEVGVDSGVQHMEE